MNIRRVIVGAASSLAGIMLAVTPVSALVHTADIADGAVTTAKIAGGSVMTANLSANAVRTSNIVNGGVTSDDISNGTIRGADLRSDIAIASAVTRTTGETGSFQPLAADLTYEGAAGGTSYYHSGVMGNFLGDTLTNTTSSLHAGVIGSYNVTTSDANTGAQAGVVGEVGDGAVGSGTAAVMAVLGGDGGALTPDAAYGVQYFNSTAGSHFSYGLDLSHAATADYGSSSAVDYGTADVRLQNGETISNGTDGKITLVGSLVQQTNTVASAAGNIALPQGNVITLSGTATVTSITAAASDAGRVVTLINTSTAQLADGNNLKLSGAGPNTADDTITLVCDGTNWYEVARSVN